jgi:hypothetical protein
MNYPTEILPNEKYKLITCDLPDHYLIRFTSSNNIEIIWDNILNQLSQSAVCHPRDQITDLSTSLLGIYDLKHIQIDLTNIGRKEYCVYCQPDENIPVPIFNEHFVLNLNRGFWVVKIGKILGQEANFTFGDIEGKFIAICYVVHTPMRWNYWHFSIRWYLPDIKIFLNELSDIKLRNKYAKRLSGEARALIAQFGEINYPNFYLIPNDCYMKP